MKAVVDHADGTPRDVRHRRHLEGHQGRRVHHRHGHDPQRRLRRQRRALRRPRRAARLGHGRLRRLRLAARLRDRPAPAAAEPAARDLQPPRPGDLPARLRDDPPEDASPSSPTAASSPTSARSARRPAARYDNGVAGRPLVMQTSYRLNNTTLAAAAARRRDDDHGRERVNFVVGDKITVDQAANGFGKGDPETRTITATAPADGHARRRRSAAPRERPLRRGLARRHEHPRHAGLQPRLVVHAEGRRADRPGLTVLGLALPADPAARRGRDLARTTSPRSCSTERARGPPGDLRLRQRDAQRGLRADAALRASTLGGDRSSTRRRARRASSPATRSTSPTRT